MMRLLFWTLLCYLGFRIFSSLGKNDRQRPAPRRERGPICSAHRDPVCGTYVTEDDAVMDSHRGERLYFCSTACRDRYREHTDQT